MRNGIVHHKSDRKSCVIPTADRNTVNEPYHFLVPKRCTNSSHVFAKIILYQNNRVQFSAPFWYRWPNFGPLAHRLNREFPWKAFQRLTFRIGHLFKTIQSWRSIGYLYYMPIIKSMFNYYVKMEENKRQCRIVDPKVMTNCKDALFHINEININ